VISIEMLKVLDVPENSFGMAVDGAYMCYSSADDFELPGKVSGEFDVLLVVSSIVREMWQTEKLGRDECCVNRCVSATYDYQS